MYLRGPTRRSSLGFAAAVAAPAIAASGPAAPLVAAAIALATVAPLIAGKLINKPGPGKIYQKQCEAAGYKWNPNQWTLTGNCVVPDWNDALALMKAAGDLRVCVSLIPTRSGICPNVCVKPASSPAKAVGFDNTTKYAQSGGNCGLVAPDTGTFAKSGSSLTSQAGSSGIPGWLWIAGGAVLIFVLAR